MRQWIKETHQITPRRPRFNFKETPKHWVADDPLATQMLNVINPITPAPERWFCQTFRDALPLIRDERLREAALAFIKQEGAHSHGHTLGTRRMEELGIELSEYGQLMNRIFDELIGPKPFGRELKNPRTKLAWLKARLAMVAAAEHLTGVLGHWTLNAEIFHDAVTDPEMAELCLWHAAEEVEHREVADAMFRHISGNIPLRTAAALVIFPLFGTLAYLGIRQLVANDEDMPHSFRIKDYLRAARQGRIPGPGLMLKAGLRYFAPNHSPLREGNTEQALAYLKAWSDTVVPPLRPAR